MSMFIMPTRLPNSLIFKKPSALPPLHPLPPQPDRLRGYIREGEKTYKVEAGDTLESIADDNYETSVEELMKLNPQISNKDLIFEGQDILVPNWIFVNRSYFLKEDEESILEMNESLWKMRESIEILPDSTSIEELKSK